MDCHVVHDVTEPQSDKNDPVLPVLGVKLPKTRLIMPSSRHILFPFDFSERAKALLPYVGNVARKFGSDITLLYVLGPYEGVHPSRIDAFDVGHFQDKVREQSEAELLRLSAGALTAVNVIPVVEAGDIAHCISRRVSTHDIGLILIPTHGRGKFRQLLLGSVTSKVLHDNSCPVWTTAHAESVTAKHSSEIRNIVCAVDSAADSSHVLEAATDLASVYGADVHLVHAIPIQQDPNFDRLLFDTAREQIMTLQQSKGTSWDLQVNTGSVAHVVRDAAVQEQADLVIIGRSRVTERLSSLWTHVEEIIREAPCAVLSV